MSTPPALETLSDDRSTLTTRALEALRAAIVDGRLEAGERYSVAQLAERFGVRVLETTEHDLEEVFALRLLLEAPATRRACDLLSDAELAALDR